MKPIATCRTALGATALALVLVLSACGADENTEPDSTPEIGGETTAAPDGPAAGVVGSGTHACGEGDIEITDHDADIRLTGSCGIVTIRANDVDVDAENISELTVEGHDNDVEVTGEIGTLTISGDENDVEARNRIGAVTINGNDNDVESADIGAITDNGRENEIGR